MLPSQIACRNCAQQPGELCWDWQRDAQYMVDGRPAFHQERILDADSQSVPGTNIGKEAFDKVVDSSGLL